MSDPASTASTANKKLTVKYDAPPTLGRFLASTAFARVVVGPVGSGKSSACCVEILRRAVETPRGLDGIRHSRFVVIRNTYPELRDTTIPTFREWVPQQLGEWKAQEHTFVMKFGEVECEVLFRALDRPDDVAKLLSLEVTGAYLNELKEIEKAVWDLLQTRVGRYPSRRSLPEADLSGAVVRPWHGLWADTNPPDVDHWIYKLFEEAKPNGHELFRQPGGRAPGAENVSNLPDGYYERLCAGKTAEWIKVYVDGEYGFVQDGKPVLPEYQDHLHCPGTIAPFAPRPVLPFGPVPAIEPAAILLGQDFGLTPACVFGQVDPKDGQIQIFDELVSTDMGAAAFGGELVRRLHEVYPGRPASGWGDPAGEQRSQVDETTPFQVMRAAGVALTPAPTNDLTLRLEAVRKLLRTLTTQGRPALVISDRCRTLRKALQGGYRYRRIQVSGAERYADVPDKNAFSHVADALQYLCVGRGEHLGVLMTQEQRLRLELSVRFGPDGGGDRCITEFNHLDEA